MTQKTISEDSMTIDELHDYHERAAIHHYEGGLAMFEAEKIAMQMILDRRAANLS